MTISVSPLVRYIDAEGKLTADGLRLFVLLLAMLDDHEARIAALEP